MPRHYARRVGRGEAKPCLETESLASAPCNSVCAQSRTGFYGPRGARTHYRGGRNNRLVCRDSAAFPDVGTLRLPDSVLLLGKAKTALLRCEGGHGGERGSSSRSAAAAAQPGKTVQKEERSRFVAPSYPSRRAFACASTFPLSAELSGCVGVSKIGGKSHLPSLHKQCWFADADDAYDHLKVLETAEITPFQRPF